jgi:hypothetical protein
LATALQVTFVAEGVDTIVGGTITFTESVPVQPERLVPTTVNVVEVATVTETEGPVKEPGIHV